MRLRARGAARGRAHDKPHLCARSPTRPPFPAGGEDYIFALLTGYCDPPAGVVVNTEGGQHYNPYFAGGKIGMAKQLNDGGVEYPDGTPATASQMAKDVAVFLAWAAEPDSDVRKQAGIKWMGAILLAAGITGYYKRASLRGLLAVVAARAPSLRSDRLQAV